MSNLQTFECERGHIMGLIHETGRGMKELWIYQSAIDTLREDGGDIPRVIAIVDSAKSVYCTVCECDRPWIPGKAELEQIIDRGLRHRRERVAQKADNRSIIEVEEEVII